MPGIKEKRSYPGRSAKDCYQASLQALSQTGYKIIRKRDYGWFVIASRTVSGQEVTCNILASLGESASLDINISARGLAVDALEIYAQELFDHIQSILG